VPSANAIDPAARQLEYLATLKTLLDEVNAEDRPSVEWVFCGVSAPLAKAAHLSRLERPTFDLAQYLARRLTEGSELP
jgi:choline monooxygenase